MTTRYNNQWVRVTKSVVDKTPPNPAAQTFIRDPELKGFGVRITPNGVKSFIVEKRVNGRPRRITLGRYGELTCEQARKRAQQVLGQIAFGEDPVAEKRRRRHRGVTLQQAYADFKKARPQLKPHTVYDYDGWMKRSFSDWQRKALVDITPAMIAARHKKIGTEVGEYSANGAMRFLRAVFNVAIPTYDDGTGRSVLTDNPVAILTRTRAWYRTERRRTVIKRHELAAWYQAVDGLTGDTVENVNDTGIDMGAVVRDFLLVLLLTGMRRSEAMRLHWSNVDFKDRTLTVPDTKNHTPLVLPLSDLLMRILRRREAEAVNAWVFPNRFGSGPLTEPKFQIQRVVEASGIPFSPHDLRRTFTTAADALELSPYVIKRLVNHKMSGDVTAGYIITDVERLRGPMQQISDYLGRAMGMVESNVVILSANAL